MVKASSASIAILVLSLLALSSAEPLRRRLSARQEEAPPSPSPTGYPEAGITPSVPFDLPSSTAKPENTYLPPDNTYGPPDNTYGPPDNTYGPPEADSVPVPESEPEPQPESPIETDDIPETEEESLVEDEDGTVIVVASSLDQPQPAQNARLYQRFPQGRRYRQPVPQRLILRRSW
ncbi:hypothetical protein M5D96_009330 [Drosophila gunungcola]|uniref:DUF4794 domain-containing protein n=1 Tax=Drosophila gunungcola TaxID=103775 RepID=A0A9P9YJS6_9MUSC|nr:hypothetical protein M5D96_009330 [Drosophila gunungcola]